VEIASPTELSTPSKGTKGKKKNKGKGKNKGSKKQKAKASDEETEPSDGTLEDETESSDNDGDQSTDDKLKGLIPHIALKSKVAFKSWINKELAQEHQYIYPHPSARVLNGLETYSVCFFVFVLKPCELILRK
jgi:hypothetical protein